MPQRVRFYANEVGLFGDLLRRYVRFHYGEDMDKLCGKCWGLASYGSIRPVREKGYIKSTCTKAEKQGWYSPSKEILETVIKPAFFIYRDDTGKYGHDTTTINFETYIYEAIRQLDLVKETSVRVKRNNQVGFVAEIQKNSVGRNIFVVQYSPDYSDGYYGEELEILKPVVPKK